MFIKVSGVYTLHSWINLLFKYSRFMRGAREKLHHKKARKQALDQLTKLELKQPEKHRTLQNSKLCSEVTRQISRYTNGLIPLILDFNIYHRPITLQCLHYTLQSNLLIQAHVTHNDRSLILWAL